MEAFKHNVAILVIQRSPNVGVEECLISHLTGITLSCISLAKCKMPQNKQGVKAAKVWEIITEEDSQRLVMSVGSRLHAITDRLHL